MNISHYFSDSDILPTVTSQRSAPVMFRVDVVRDSPCSQFVPLVERSPVDGQAQLQVDVLCVVQVNKDLLDNVGEVFTVDHIVSLHEDLAESRFSDGIILCIELVKSMEGVPILERKK